MKVHLILTLISLTWGFYILLRLICDLSGNHARLTFKVYLESHHLIIPHEKIIFVWAIMIFHCITVIAFKKVWFFLYLLLYDLFSTKQSTPFWCKTVQITPVFKTLHWFHISHRVTTKVRTMAEKVLRDLVSKYLSDHFCCLITHLTLPHWSFSFTDMPVMFIF